MRKIRRKLFSSPSPSFTFKVTDATGTKKRKKSSSEEDMGPASSEEEQEVIQVSSGEERNVSSEEELVDISSDEETQAQRRRDQIKVELVEELVEGNSKGSNPGEDGVKLRQVEVAMQNLPTTSKKVAMSPNTRDKKELAEKEQEKVKGGKNKKLPRKGKVVKGNKSQGDSVKKERLRKAKDPVLIRKRTARAERSGSASEDVLGDIEKAVKEEQTAQEEAGKKDEARAQEKDAARKVEQQSMIEAAAAAKIDLEQSLDSDEDLGNGQKPIPAQEAGQGQ